MKLILGLLLSANLLAATSNTISVTSGSQSIEGVTLGDRATLTKTDDTQVNLVNAGFGVRVKKVALMNVKIYVAQLFVSELDRLDKAADRILSSLDAQTAAMLKITLIRNVTGEQIKESFESALQANSVDTKRADMQNFFNVVMKYSPEVGDSYDFVSLDTNHLLMIFNSASGTKSDVVELRTSDIWSIWFGVPADAGMKKLKDAILTN